MAPDHDGPHPWLPLTRAQQGLWFADELAGGSAAYTTAEVVEVPAPGLDHARLAHAQARAHREHEQLRTRFAATPDGPRQQVLDLDDATLAARLEHVTVADRATADAWLVATLARPLRIAEGEVVRSALLHLADGSTWWFHAAHHVVLDGYGYLQLARRVADLYRDPTAAPPRAATVADLVAEDTARTVDAAWWDDRLAGWDGTSSPVGSPVDSPAAATPAPAPHRAEVELDPAAGDDLAAVARAFRVGIDAVVLAAAGTYLARLLEPAGPEGPEGSAGHVRLGVPLMNRTGPSGRALTATTVCTAMNVVPLAVPATGRPSDVVRAVAAELAAVRDGAHVRAEDLERRLRRRAPDARLFGPTVNVLPFASELDLGPRGTPLVGRVRNLAAGPVEDLTWGVRGAIGRGPVRVEVAAHPERYDAGATALHAHRLATWLGTFARAAVTVTANRADGEHDVTDLPLLHAAERHLVVATFNATDHPVRPTTLPAAFAAQVARTPGAPAVLRHAGDPADPGAWEAWTYADLDDAAGRVAAGLRARGAGRGDVVALRLPRSRDLYAAVHGVHRAGAAYLPVDPDAPADRVRDMLTDADVRVLLDAADVAGLIADAALAPVRGAGPAEADDAAYVLFTSGSTGRPKGVRVSHRAIDNRLAWMQGAFPLDAGSTVLHKTPVTFDVSVWELFWPLQVGAAVVVAADGGHRDPRYLADVVRHGAVDTVHFVPAMLRAFLADDAATAGAAGRLRRLFCSGEALTTDLVDAAAARLGVVPVNLYGPTEAAVDVTCHRPVPGARGAAVPLGRPVWNTRCYVVDPRGEPTPVGVAGELVLAGVQLADGYVGRPDLTAAAFTTSTLPERPGERWYRTGDVARWRADGVLEYLGRRDGQVKLHGQRLELGEVEAVLGRVPGVSAVGANVLDEPDGARLVAWFSRRGSVAPTVDDLRAAADAYLPAGSGPRRTCSSTTSP